MSVADAGRGQRGFTMIEALVTFVILAIGVLGIVTLMVNSKTSQYEAVQRARAVSLADGMLERIRENPGGLPTYTARDADNPLGQSQMASEPSPDCQSGTCNAEQMANHDLWVWEQQLDGNRVTVTEGGTTTGTAGLKAARGCILFDDYGGHQRTGQITVLVQWEGLHESVDGVSGTDTVCGAGAPDTNNRRRQVLVRSFVVDDL